VSIENLCSERNYLDTATEVHATAMFRAGAKTITLPPPPGTLAERTVRAFEAADVKYSKEAVSNLISRELRERESIPVLSGRARVVAPPVACRLIKRLPLPD